MEISELQQQLFSHLKESQPSNLSMVDGLCDLLNLSSDSVYRRIRGEKPITLNELKKICESYRLSLDKLLQLQNDSVLFQAPGINGDSKDFGDYLKGGLAQFKYFNSFQKTEIQYLCKETPIWNFFLFPEIAAFKTFFWTKTINNHPGLSHKSFSIEEFPYHDCFVLGQRLLEEYNKVPCIELWNLESIHSTINQLAYYRDAGNFKSQNDFDVVVNSFHQMIDHLQLQAEKGRKFMPGASEQGYKAPLQFYINELILGNNTMVVTLDGKHLSMVTYSVFQYLFTSDLRFSTKVINSFDTLLNCGTLISKTGEKDRNKFFNALRDKVNMLCK